MWRLTAPIGWCPAIGSVDLFKVRADNLNHVLSRFLARFRILRHVVEDVVLHEFSHEAVDRAPGSRETTKDLGALLVSVQPFEDGFELSNYLLGSIDQIQFFSGGMRHFC
jgi:hypothetical protein